MTYNKCITNEGKDQILKIAFLNENVNPFKYCALGYDDSSASTTGIDTDFHEFNEPQYQRVQLNTDEPKIENNTLTVSCIFEDNNSTNGTVGEIALCDAYDGDNTTFFAFSQVPQIEKTDNVSLKYTWVIGIE